MNSSLRSIKQFLTITLLVVLGSAKSAAASPWNLPQLITDSNCEIRYKYYSNNNRTTGRIKGVKGRAWVEGNNSNNIRADITVPVPNPSEVLALPEAMKNLLDGLELPPARLILNRIDGLCSPATLASLGSCPATIIGQVIFAGSTKPVKFPIRMATVPGGYKIDGKGVFYPSDTQLLGMIQKVEANFLINLFDRPITTSKIKNANVPR